MVNDRYVGRVKNGKIIFPATLNYKAIPNQCSNTFFSRATPGPSPSS